MAKPVVGVTTRTYCRRAGEDPPVLVKDSMSCGVPYLECVERSGGAPVLVPPTTDGEATAAAMARVDALLLTGGGDVDPAAYGEEPHPKTKGLDPVRDGMEREAVRVALARGLPVLGICRGMQSLNVALGGTLVQDVATEIGKTVKHRTYGDEVRLAHAIDIEEGTLLARALGVTSAEVNSRHHQAVKVPGEGLRVNARAPDGVIEGLEAASPPEGGAGLPVLCVQWHPENLYDDFRGLFDWLVEEAAKHGAT